MCLGGVAEDHLQAVEVAQEAYDLLCPDNPAALPDKKEEHRALSDAVMEGWILLRYLEDNPDAKQRYLRCLQ